MAELPLDQAVPRFKANEDRLDTFVNSATGYTTSGGTSVQSIQQFLASIGSNGIDFVDNAKARFGTGNDLEIYHSGSGSFIRDTGTGDLTIDGSAISIQTASAERISVSASGINVTGTVEFDGLSGTGAVTITDIADEDNMASNSATKLATQQSIKAYVDTQVATIPIGDITSVVAGTGLTGGGTTGDVTLNIGAGTGITVNADDIAIDATVATLTGTQTFTNKTLTSAVLNTSVSGTAVLDEDDMTSNSATKLATQQSIKAYVDANAGGGGLPTTGGTMTGDILFNDSVKAKFGTSSDLQIYHDGSNSIIDDSGTGNLYIRSNDVLIDKYTGERMIRAVADGAVTLYHNNVEKLATTSTGIDVTGNASLSGASTRRIDISNTSLADTGEMATLQWDNSANLTIQGRTSTGSFAANWYSIQTSDTDGRADAHIFYTDASTERMRVDSGGIEVTNQTDISMDGSASGQFKVQGSGYGFGIALDADAANIYTNSASRDLVFGVNETEVARVKPAGLDVTGATNTTGTSGSRQWSAGSAGQKLGIYAYDNSTFYHRLETGNATNYQWGAYDNIPIYTITNNTIKTTLLGNGNFGIGDTNPSAKLTVAGSAKFSTPDNGGSPATTAILDIYGFEGRGAGIKIRDSANSASGASNREWFVGSGYNQTGFNIGYSSTGSQSSYAAQNKLTIDTSGRVGIGTTAPTAKMHLFTDGIDQSMFSAQADLGVQNRILTLKSPVSDSSTQPFRWQTSNSILWEIDSTETKSMLLNSAGNLGIGTYSPTQKLEIAGKIQVTSTDPEIFLTDTTTNVDHSIDANSGVGNLFIHVDKNNEGSDPKLIVNVGSQDDVLVAKSTGIDVTGDLTVSSTIEVGSLTPNQDGAIEVGVIALGTPAISSTTDSTSLRNHIIFDNPNGAVGKINTLNSSTTYLTSSDYRLKTDVQEMTGSIDRVKALRPVNFEWVVDGTRVDGFLAHEAQEVVPEAVDGEKDAMRDQEYVESAATGDIYTPAVEATYETIQVELTPAVQAVYETVTVEISPAVEATYDEDGNELTPAIEAVTEEQEQLVTPAVDATYEEQEQELTPAVDEVIHSSDVVEPDELEEGQLWRETTEKVMATRQVPDYQGIDQSKIVPLLTSALQDAITKIEALETRLEALEA